MIACAVSLPACTAVRDTSTPRIAPPDSISDYIRRVREISARVAVAHPGAADRRQAGDSAAAPRLLESSDPALAAALARVGADPSAASHVAAADVYLQRGIEDRAFDHYTKASRLDPKNGRAYEGLARIWRQWGLPHLALGDAHRGVHYAPRSAAARNTLGMVMEALGLLDAAAENYRRATELDANAAYAFNNLCYVALQQKQRVRAEGWCRAALRLEPGLPSARNNLALVLGATATASEIHAAIGPGGGPGERELAAGLALLANARPAEAAAVLEEAVAMNPALGDRAARARAAATRFSGR